LTDSSTFTTWLPTRFPLGVMTPSEQLDAWASSPMYLGSKEGKMSPVKMRLRVIATAVGVGLAGHQELHLRRPAPRPDLEEWRCRNGTQNDTHVLTLLMSQPPHRISPGHGRAAPMMPIRERDRSGSSRRQSGPSTRVRRAAVKRALLELPGVPTFLHSRIRSSSAAQSTTILISPSLGSADDRNRTRSRPFGWMS